MKLASSFVEWSVNKIISEVENVIEREDPAKNSSIASKIEKALDNPDKVVKFT